jgi:multicomponent Na+:H+ antiporter subunit F
MTLAYDAFVLLLVANLAAGCVRILRGPSPADRMLAAQLFGTAGVALLLALAQVQALPELRDVALVFALLALLAVVVFVRRVATRREAGGDGRT